MRKEHVSPARALFIAGRAARLIPLVLALFALIAAGHASAMDEEASGKVPVPKKYEERVKGFLGEKELPDSFALLSPPPAKGSAAYGADEEAYRAAIPLRGTARWKLAREDSDLGFPGAPNAFSCALGIPITREATPRLSTLLERTRSDGGWATAKVKEHYRKTRPYVAFGVSTCTPEDEAFLKRNGSYPSGHSAIGWTWALILAELAPERSDAILERGIAYGKSRVICVMHWQSDVDAGNLLGSAVVARLHGDPGFRKEMDAARAEIAAARAKGFKPERDCKAEAAALKPAK